MIISNVAFVNEFFSNLNHLVLVDLFYSTVNNKIRATIKGIAHVKRRKCLR
jgi:hypothetical protein